MALPVKTQPDYVIQRQIPVLENDDLFFKKTSFDEFHLDNKQVAYFYQAKSWMTVYTILDGLLIPKKEVQYKSYIKFNRTAVNFLCSNIKYFSWKITKATAMIRLWIILHYFVLLQATTDEVK